MQTTSRTDEDLLAARDATSFELFYLHHVNTVLGFFARRTGDAEMAADLTSETFAAALAGRRRYKPEAGAASAWLFGIASRKLADAQRRGYAERRMCRRLGMERIELTDERGYGEIAQELQTSEAVVRKRVSRGLATARERMGRRR
jgi:DNA-directed RNA polymerase specialized sigma24 family protein